LIVSGICHECFVTDEQCNLFYPPLPLAGEGGGEAEGGPLASGYNLFPLTAAFPATGSRNPYLYIEERERHPDFSDLHTADRDYILSPRGEERVAVF
jgi:hypothetical protein